MPGTDSIRHPLTRTLLVLTATTGVIDAACYLGLGRVFAANMTGNVVLLGFGIAGSTGLPVVAPLVSLLAFLAGAVVGGRMAARLAPKEAHLARAMIVEIVLIGLATLLATVFDITPDHFSGDLIIGLLAFAMGTRNATVRRLKVADLSTTVLTLTLTGLAADSQLARGAGTGGWRRGGAVAAMLIGAVVGALLVKADLALVLLAAGLLTLTTWLIFMPAAITSADPR
ncbi:MAG TPA: YoaK family protein [Solirubrobacterales bacterium]